MKSHDMPKGSARPRIAWHTRHRSARHHRDDTHIHLVPPMRSSHLKYRVSHITQHLSNCQANVLTFVSPCISRYSRGELKYSADMWKRGEMPLAQPIVVDRGSPIPLYFQVAQQIEASIESGDLKPGETIPSEFDFAEQLGVSRPTIRQAIQQLVIKGYVVRRRGIGTVVVHRRLHRPASTSSFYDALMLAGRAPRTEVLHLANEPADDDVARRLRIEPGTAVFALSRIRYADGEPIAHMTNHIPMSIIVEMPSREQLEVESLYSLLRRRGIELDYADQEISARTATPKEARLLLSSRGVTLLTMSRVAYDTTGQVIELGQHVYLADRYSFEMILPIR